MDPVGTVRREEHEGGRSIWVRQDPGYPDNQLTGTEWTCVWSTVPGKPGDRLEDETASAFTLVGAVPDTPADTGEDVEVGDRVRLLISYAFGKTGRIEYHGRGHLFAVQTDEDKLATKLRRIDFEKIEER